MRSCSPSPVERARPLLGTLVAIRVYDLPEASAHRAIDAAFAEIAATHRAMSFHQPDSEVSRLNRDAYCRPVQISPHTRVVLQLALCFGEATDGVFDITTAAQLVRWGLLPRPASFLPPDPQGSWRGIAKGYAVDRAVVCLSRHGVRRCCVNAGGDLRVVGAAPERIGLRVSQGQTPFAAVLALEDGSLASSGDHSADATPSTHVNGINRRPMGHGIFACVLAESCAVADALTKPVLALGQSCDLVLRRFGATAHLLDTYGNWQHFGATA
jgi:FAD:protein FMN transferase